MAQHPLRGFLIIVTGLVAVAAIAVTGMNVFESTMVKWGIAGVGALAAAALVLIQLWGDDSESAPAAPGAAAPAGARPAAVPADSSEEVMNTVRLAMTLKKLTELQTAHDQIAKEHKGCQDDRAESIAAHEAAMARAVALESDAFAMRKEIEELRSALSAAGVTAPAETGASQAAADEERLLKQKAAELEHERDESRAACARALAAERAATLRAEAAEQDARKAHGQVAEMGPFRAAAVRATELEASNALLRQQMERLEADLLTVRRRAGESEAAVKRLEAMRGDEGAATAAAHRDQQTLREQLGQLEAELAEAKRRGDTAEASVKHLETTRSYEEAAAAVAKREQQSLRERLSRVETELTEAKRRSEASEAAAKKLEASRGGESAAVADARREHQALRDHVAQLETDLSASKRRGDAAEASVRRLEASHGDAGTAAAAAQREQQALRERVTRLEADLAEAGRRGDAAEASVRQAETARRDEGTAAAAAQRDLHALRERLTRAETDLADAKRRGDAAQTAIAQLETSRAESERRHAADSKHVQTLTADLTAHAERAKLLATEVAALHASVASAEDAVRAVLHELGADPAALPLTVAGVTQAIAPLTLLALGEDTPGWKSNPDADTLAAAIVHLAQDAADRRDQIARLSAAVARQPAARR